MELLANKYGPQDEEGLFDSFYDSKQITQGNRYILTKVTGFTDVSIEIRYYDTKLENQAEKERIQLEAKSVNSDGL